MGKVVEHSQIGFSFGKWIKMVVLSSVMKCEKWTDMIRDRNRTHDLPNTGRVLYPLSFESHGEQGHWTESMCDRRSAYCLDQGCRPSHRECYNWITMVNFKLGNEMCHVDQFTFHVSLPSLKCSHLLEVGHVQWVQHVRSVPYKKKPKQRLINCASQTFCYIFRFPFSSSEIIGFYQLHRHGSVM